MQEFRIIVHSDKIKVDDWDLEYKLNNALINSAKFKTINNTESGAMSNYMLFSYTFKVKDTFTIHVFGDIDFAWEICNVIFECDSVCEELTGEFVKAFEEYFETKLCCKLRKEQGVAYLEIYDAE